MIFILLLFTHMKMKKMLIGAFLGIFAVAGVAVLPNYANAQEETPSEWAQPDPGKQYIWDQDLTWSAILSTIKNAINWVLWILATIALVICLYGWFKMVTAAGDEKKYGEWLKVLKYAAIGLAIVGLSWMIVSVVFWFISTMAGWNKTQWSQVQTTIQSDGAGTSFYGWTATDPSVPDTTTPSKPVEND